MLYFNSIEIMNENNNTQYSFSTDDKIIIKVEATSKRMFKGTDFLFFIRSNITGKRLFIIEKNVESIFNESEFNYPKTISIVLDNNFLMPGMYHCEIGFLSSINEYIDRKEFVGTFEVSYGSTPLSKYGDRDIGNIFPRYKMDVL